MTMTPQFIAEFLTPWVLAVLSYPVLLFSLLCLVGSGPRVAASVLTRRPPYGKGHRRPFTNRDVRSSAILAVESFALALAINEVVPAGPQWWTHPLASGWEIGFGFAMVAIAVAGPLLYMAAALMTAITGLALVSWLAEPIDDEPESPTRMQMMRRSAAQAWYTTLRRRSRA